MHTVVQVSLLLVIAAASVTSPAALRDSSSARHARPAQAAAHESPFACNVMALNPQQRKRHFDELSPMLRSLKKGHRELPDGYEFEFPSDSKTFQLLAEWSDQERLCCPFFDVAVRFDHEGGPLWLRLTGREGTKDFIKVDFAQWFSH